MAYHLDCLLSLRLDDLLTIFKFSISLLPKPATIADSSQLAPIAIQRLLPQ